jgi:hypothetical protein
MQIDRFTLVSVGYVSVFLIILISIGVSVPEYIRYFPFFGLFASGIFMLGIYISEIMKKRRV